MCVLGSVLRNPQRRHLERGLRLRRRSETLEDIVAGAFNGDERLGFGRLDNNGQGAIG